MPLLRRLVFVKQKPPSDLKLDEELFFCKFTNEVFRDYEAFFERTILCNSLVWTCKYTGRPGLTYQEALDSEARARKNLRTFPEALKRPVLFLATLTRRGRLADMCDDVFVYTKDRFFVGETVEVLLEDSRLQCTILKVISPSKENLEAAQKSQSDSENDLNTSNEENEKSKRFGPDSSLYQYQVQDENATYVVSGADVSRKKGLFTREKSKLFLKQHCEPHLGIWKVKDSFLKKLNVTEKIFHECFDGLLPCFTNSPAKKRLPNDKEITEIKKLKKKTEESPEIDKKKVTKEKIKEDDPRLSAEEKAIIKEKIKQEIEEARMKKKLEKEKEREKLKEERRLKAEYMKEWSKPRDDLECDDLKDLPNPKIIKTVVPPDQFGEMIALLEFLYVFGNYLEIEDEFPHGVSFEILEQALTEPDIQGPMCDLLHLFLGVIFRLQEEEDENEEEGEIDNETSANNDNSELGDEELDRNKSLNPSQCSTALIRPQLYLGTPTRNLPLDNCTVTEVLRLHLLCSGSRTTATNAKFRYQQRGGFTPSDDPGLDFKLKETAILQTLSAGNVYDMCPVDKLKILTCLSQQLLTYVSARDVIEDSCEKLRLLRNELKQLQWAEQRREREEAHARHVQRLEERAKEKDSDQKVIKKSDEAMEVQENENDSLKDHGTEQNSSKNENEEDSAIESAEEEDDNVIIEEELSPEEAERRHQQRAKQSAKLKEEYKIKEKELIENISCAQSISNIIPIGRDRFYRRFWLFKSIPGLFVEEDESFKANSSLENLDSIPVKTEDDKSTNSDKENESFNGSINKIVNSTPIIMNGTAHLPHNTLASIDESIVNYQPWSKTESNDCLCTDVHKNCSVNRNTADSMPWGYYSSEKELDELLSTLNSRGFREGPLRDLLISEKMRISEIVSSCPLDNENRLYLKKNSKNINNFSSGDAALEFMLCEMLLDIEERLYSGSLGTLKVKDRLFWKDTLESKLETSSAEHNDSSENGDTSLVVKQLAQFLLDIMEGIEPKYLKPPLGEAEEKRPKKSDLSCDQKKKKKTKEENIEDKEEDEGVVDSTPRQPKTMLDKWQESLKSATNLSQIFLHLSTVERAVTWSRSSLNARCRICRRKGDAEYMLLCDGCNRGHHMYCLKPPMKDVPADDWFCTDCRPKVVHKKKSRKQYLEEMDDDYSNQSLDCSIDDFSESDSEENNLNDSSQSYEDGGGDLCAICSNGGTLILCDSCPLAFHLKCADPPLKKVPRGKWECHMCTGIADKRLSRDRSRSGRISMKNLKLQKNEKPDRSDKTKVRKKRKYRKSESKINSSYQNSSGHKRKRRDYSLSPENGLSKKYSKYVKKSRSHSSDEESDKSNISIKRANSKRSLECDSENISRRLSIGLRGSNEGKDMKSCEDLLAELCKQPEAWPFLLPVSKKIVPDYYMVIDNPMDFATMRAKINNLHYLSPAEFLSDARLIFKNCETYNMPMAPEAKAGVKLSKYLERRVREMKLESNSPTTSPVNNILKSESAKKSRI